jgi:hypothetical protein
MEEFNKSLSKNSHFKPKESLSFGQNTEPITVYAITPSLLRISDKWQVQNNYKEISGISLSDTTAFSIALNLSNLPAYAQDTAYLNQNLAVSSSDNWTIQKTILKIKDVNTSNVNNKEEVKLINESSHILNVRMRPNAIHETLINVKLPFQYDNWYELGNWSCDDDSQGHDYTNKTFMFHKIIEGISQAYNTKNDFINFSIKVKN